MNGMDANDDDDNFSDGAFDDLAPNALLELEKNAIQATQNVRDPGERTGSGGNTFQFQSVQRKPHDAFRTDPLHQARDTASENLRDFDLAEDGYGQDIWDADANVATPVEEQHSFVPPEAFSEARQRELWRVNRFGQTAPPFQEEQNRRVATFNAQNVSRPQSTTAFHRYHGGHQNGHAKPAASPDNEDVMLLDDSGSHREDNHSVEEEALRAQIEDLLRDRETLTHELHRANSEVMKQKGEISIIRSNQEKSSKTYDRQLAALKKSIEDDALRHRGELETVNNESRRIANDNQFLRHNLSEEVERIKGLQRKIKDRANESNSPVSTPRKNKSLPLRDGFNNQELAVKSPVKGGKKSGPTTPSAGNKRKRKATVSSPAPALELSPGIVNEPDEPVPIAETNKTPIAKTVILQDNKGLDFMQKVLNHKLDGNKQRMLELFINFSFPSEKGKPFSSIFFERTAALTGSNLPIELTKVIISLWAQSLDEKYYQPLPTFIDMISFILAIDPVSIAPHTIEAMTNVLQRTTELNGVQRFNHSPVSHLAFGKSKQTPKSVLVNVDETACLEMLYMSASACSHTDKHLAHFWQTISSDFILMMLNSSQLIPNIALTLNLLSTSILPSTFGTIVATETDQATIEKYIIDRVTYLLWETPRVDEGSTPYTRSDICTLRLEAMSLLSALAFSSPHPHTVPTHGTSLLAHHATAIARIFRCIYDELDALYSYPPSRDLHAQLVNDGVRIVHHLLQLHGDTIDLSQKLASINGGIQKHRVVLTRLAFSEGLLLEGGISDESVVMAHEMLEREVTMEEAEALMDVFPGSRSSAAA